MTEVQPIVASKGFSTVRKDSDLAESSFGEMSRGWMRSDAVMEQPIVNANELTSLSALIAYVAYQSGSTEFSVERQLSNRFNIPNAKLLPSNQYDSAIRYLVDSFS